METLSRRRVVIAGQTPPPVSGFSYITQQVIEAVSAEHDVTLIDISTHTQRGGVTYHLRRLWLTIKGIVPLLMHCRAKSRALYIACEGNLGIIYTLILALTGRMLGYPLYLHHHSFGYIERRSRLMALLLAAMGPRATHLFLCDAMAKRFSQRYGRNVNHIILSNSAFVSIPAALSVTPLAGRPLVIGLLSNLNEEKGLGTFLDVLRGALAQNMDVRAVLAGPAASEADHNRIARAVQEFGGRLDYRGAVYGDEKTRFLRSIDVFVFPTRYVNEAQPTVIFEAMAHGVPTLSYDRGCICGQIGDLGLTIKTNEEFISPTLEWLKRQLSEPKMFDRLRYDTQAAFARDHATVRKSLSNLFDGSMEKRDAMNLPAKKRTRIDIWHNILWSKYKGEVFSSLYANHDKNLFDLRFFQFAETAGDRVGLSGVDLNRHRYPFALLFKGSLNNVGVLRRVYAAVRRTLFTKADVVILAGYDSPEYWAQFLLLLLRRKRIAVFCDSTIHDRPQQSSRGALKSFFFRTVDGIFCYGTRSMEYVKHYGADPAHIYHRCQAAALPQEYSVDAMLEKRVLLAPPANTPRYLYVGRLSPEKSLHTLIKAFAKIRATNDRATLVFVGVGPQQEELRQHIAQLGLESCATFAGGKSGMQLFDEYLRATCLVLPSRSEPWGLVVNEALACGCPVVVSDNCGCVPELVIEGKTGFAHKVDDENDLAQKMLTAAIHFTDARATAHDCLDHIATYSPDAAAAQILDGIKGILAQ